MATEIERKWLVEHLPAEFDGLGAETISQGYLVIAEDGSEVRIRQNPTRATLTVKSGGGLVRSETEVGLSSEQFSALWEATAGRRVAKRRVDIDGDIVVDIYTDALAGLIVAEVEFASEARAAAFAPPAWFGLEVTEDRSYKNQQLALKGRPEG